MQPNKFKFGDDVYYPANNSLYLGKVIAEMLSGSGKPSTFLIQGFNGEVDAFFEAQLMTPQEYISLKPVKNSTGHAAVAAHYMGMAGVGTARDTDLDIVVSLSDIRRRAMTGSFPDIDLVNETPARKNPCECGAHAVKDARHARYCPLNN